MIPANNYIHIEYWMTELGLRPVQVWIYAIIHGFCQDGVSTYKGSQRYFREWTHSARSTVIEALNDMKAKNLIVVKEIKVGNAIYNEYYTVASRSVYQDMANKYKLEQGAKNCARVSENRTEGSTKKRQGMSEIPTSACPNSGPNDIDNNKFKNIADSTAQTQEKFDGAAAALISEKIKELFGRTDVFDSDFVYDIERVLLDSGVGDKFIGSYLQSVFEKTISKHPDSIPGLFRKLACAPDCISDFVIKMPKEKDVQKVPTTECPVCEKQTPVNSSSCCNCGFDVMDFKDTKKISFQKAINALPEAQKAEIEKDVAQVLVVGNFMDFMRPEKIKERNEKLVQIYARHGIKYEL